MGFFVVASMGSNRTFMELKLSKSIYHIEEHYEF